MTTAYLTDAAFWLSVCAQRLRELDPTGRAGAECDGIAAELYQSGAYRSLPPSAAAEAWCRDAARDRRAAS